MARHRKNKNPPAKATVPAVENRPRRWAAIGVCCCLALAVFLVFGQSVGGQFINFDDHLYVYETPMVTAGPTVAGIRWAFSTDRAGNWHPLTWLSLMLDGAVSGSQPWAYHVTNVLLHAAAAIFLFLALWRMTDMLWTAAFCAALFAVHPLRAESVAWISERKDVLSGLFFMLALLAYAGYVRRRSVSRYLLVTACFVFGLMSKPAVVTLPFVLLLLDYWPLGRTVGDEASGERKLPVRACRTGRQQFSIERQQGADAPRSPFHPSIARLLFEKLPWFAIAAASCVISPIAQGSCMFSLARIPFDLRVANGLVAYVMYVVHFFWPMNLSAFYPHPGPSMPLLSWKPLAAAVLLLGVSAAAVRWRRRFPWLFVGWFWYVGMLVPMIGLVQVGSQAMADRYTYLSEIGLCIAVAWSVTAAATAVPAYRRWIQGVGVAAIVGLMAMAAVQVAYWHDSLSLWRHAVACNADCALAHFQLGDAMLRLQRDAPELAVEQFRAALAINPDYPDPKRTLGIAAIRIGEKKTKQGDFEAAAKWFQEATAANPSDVDAHYDLGVTWNRLGKTPAALAEWRTVLRLRPNDAGALDQLAWALATHPDAANRNGPEAVALAERLVQLTGGREPDSLATLAAAQAECGRFSEAAATLERAMALAAAKGNRAANDAFRSQLHAYRSGKAYRERPDQQK